MAILGVPLVFPHTHTFHGCCCTQETFGHVHTVLSDWEVWNISESGVRLASLSRVAYFPCVLTIVEMHVSKGKREYLPETRRAKSVVPDWHSMGAFC